MTTTETTADRTLQATERPGQAQPAGRWYPGHPDYAPAPSPEEARRLSPHELHVLQARWYMQALEHGDLQVARTIAGELGASRRTGDRAPIRVYDRGGLHIEVTGVDHLDDWEQPLAIDVGRQTVCRDGVGWDLFVPGPWIEALRQAGHDAVLARERREQERHGDEARQVRQHLLLEQGESAEGDAEGDGSAGTDRQRGR